MKMVCVYCGSSPGSRTAYCEAATELAAEIVSRGAGVVYGGASIGVMGAIADGVLAAGGKVIGVIPQSLMDLEIAHLGLSELRVVNDMHERKAAMAELSDGFIAMPGGYGTLEELFEMLTWSQLGFHQKPVAVMNTDQYFDGLLAFLDRQQSEGFVKPEHREILLSAEQPADLMDKMMAYQARYVTKL